MRDYGILTDIFEQALQKVVDNKWVTVAHQINPRGVASTFTEALIESEDKETEKREMEQALTFMQKHFPKQFDEIIEKGKV